MGERYRLPASMGGHECEIVNENDQIASVRYAVPSDGGALVRVHSSVPHVLLTPVKPPLPPEPREGRVVACGIGAKRGDPLPVARRWADGWEFYGGGPDDHDGTHTWSGVVRFSRSHCGSDPVLLVPDPLAGEPIEVDVDYTDRDGARIRLHGRDSNGDVPIEVIPSFGGPPCLVFLPRLVAAGFARAVWAAATQAEAGAAGKADGR